MNTKTRFLSLLIGISFFSCTNTVKNTAIPISNIDTDFPVTENLDFKAFNTYGILKNGFCVIDDSILWHFEEGESDFGCCYNLTTAKKLSTIVSKGRAANEVVDLAYFDMVGDSVAFYTNKYTIKTFAKKDIIDNKPMGERPFSVTIAPDSIWASRMAKLPNGSVIATIQPALFDYQKDKAINEINQKTVAVFNHKEANSYETIKYESFDIEKAKGTELAANDLIKCAYSYGSIGIKDNNVAAFSVSNQFILYTFDINSGNVINEKRYTKMQRTGEGDEAYVSFETMNDRHLSVHFMKLNDKYILCAVDGFLSEDDKKAKLNKKAIFVFDWDLNPIKKFDLPERKNGCYAISNDCKSVYFCEYNEDGLTLYKADLNI